MMIGAVTASAAERRTAGLRKTCPECNVRTTTLNAARCLVCKAEWEKQPSEDGQCCEACGKALTNKQVDKLRRHRRASGYCSKGCASANLNEWRRERAAWVPTLEEIQRQTEAIQSTWTEEEFWRRSGGGDVDDDDVEKCRRKPVYQFVAPGLGERPYSLLLDVLGMS